MPACSMIGEAAHFQLFAVNYIVDANYNVFETGLQYIQAQNLVTASCYNA